MSRLESSVRGWRKSSRCDSNACVEVAQLDDGVGVRNSTRPQTRLVFDDASWHGLLHDLRGGRFDRR
jgi:hypothetical protein